MQFKFTCSNMYQQKIKQLAHCPFFFRSSTLRNVLDRALTSVITTFHPLFLSLFDKVDFNRPCNSSYIWPYACIKAIISAMGKVVLIMSLLPHYFHHEDCPR